MEEAEKRIPSDSPAKFRATVLRVNRQGNMRRAPVVVQAAFDGGVELEAVTGGQLKRIGGKEAANAQATLLGRIDPSVARTADRQRRAIAGYYTKPKR